MPENKQLFANLLVEVKHACNYKTKVYELRKQATKCCCWEVMVLVWTVYAFLPFTPPTSLISFLLFLTAMEWFRPNHCTTQRKRVGKWGKD